MLLVEGIPLMNAEGFCLCERRRPEAAVIRKGVAVEEEGANEDKEYPLYHTPTFFFFISRFLLNHFPEKCF